MYILGISNAWTSGATLLKEGKVVAAVNEERFNRIKMYGGFPYESIRYVLGVENITINNVDHIAYGWMKGLDLERELPALVQRAMEAASNDPAAMDIIQRRIASEHKNDNAIREAAITVFKELGVLEKVRFFDHHESHAASAFFSSPFAEALVVTIDGRGDFKSATVSLASREKGLQLIDWKSSLDSIGAFYGVITSICGYQPQRHEGKITGLAAYGNPEICLPIMKKMIDFTDGTIKANIGTWYKPFDRNPTDALVKALSNYKKEDIAAAVQKQTEEIIVKYVSNFVAQHNLKYVCLAGGVFANVRVNQEILNIPGVENIYVHPNMGDGGISTGGAYLLNFSLGGQNPPLTDVYLGPSFTNEEIERILIEKYPELPRLNVRGKRSEVVVDLLKKNKIVGFFEGRMEYGPRALGARTILYHARDKKVNDWLNSKLHRTEFMPFAPVTTAENAPRCYIGWKPDHIASRFMTLCYDCTEEMKQKSPATVHLDGTARPQIIYREDNPAYYDVVKQYCDETGDVALINTSFNQHEEPIVCTPKDAIESFKRGNVDVLSIGDFIVGKID